MILPASVGCAARSIPPVLLSIAGACALAGSVGIVSITPVEVPINGVLPMTTGTVGLVATEQATIMINGVLPMPTGDVMVTTDAIFDVTGTLPMTTGTVGLVAIDPVLLMISGVLPMTTGTVTITTAPGLPYSLTTTPTGQKTSAYIEFQITVPSDAYSASRKIYVAVANNDGTGDKAATVNFSPGNLGITWHKPDTSYQTYNYGDVSGSWMAPGSHTIRIASVGNEFQFVVDSTARITSSGDYTYWPSNPSYIVADGFTLEAAPVVSG